MKLNYFLALPLLAIAVSSCKPKPQMPPMAALPTMNVGTADRQISSHYSARIRSAHFVDIRPQVSGVITKIAISEGDAVRKGQLLFVIDQIPYKAALEVAKANTVSAKARVATAELNLNSSVQLKKANVVSDYDLQTSMNSLAEAKASLALAQAQELNARNNLSYTEIKSPVDGYASMIPYRVGALVSSTITEPLVSVSSNDKMYAYFSISEVQMLELTQSRDIEQVVDSLPPVGLRLVDGQMYELEGKVDAVSGNIDPTTGAITLRAVFDNPKSIIRDGSVGSVVITSQKDNVIVIPQEATFSIQNNTFAYKVVDGKATAAVISVEPLNNGVEYIVNSGLKEGERIISKGAGLVREGTPVDPQQAPAAAPAGDVKPEKGQK